MPFNVAGMGVHARTQVSRERFLYTRVADGMASMLRADIDKGINGSCGAPVPQVLVVVAQVGREIWWYDKAGGSRQAAPGRSRQRVQGR